MNQTKQKSNVPEIIDITKLDLLDPFARNSETVFFNGGNIKDKKYGNDKYT
ncbi:hypothetical protein [Desulfoluna butyratoxydans]|uniref:hypothetical protein n=1 Tax=Desulfoluna butyratoxydans TaxID=231438 RepID=UPI0015D1BE73|nr:hypothetical protein [Desulfoluna butyratoxydans]